MTVKREEKKERGEKDRGPRKSRQLPNQPSPLLPLSTISSMSAAAAVANAIRPIVICGKSSPHLSLSDKRLTPLGIAASRRTFWYRQIHLAQETLQRVSRQVCILHLSFVFPLSPSSLSLPSPSFADPDTPLRPPCPIDTTRAPRPGEQPGVSYHFTSREKFLDLVKEEGFIEHAEFSGNLYGSSAQSVRDVLKSGKMCILDIDTQVTISSTFSLSHICFSELELTLSICFGRV